ncbi:MAG: lysostaphin resistance A-like protein [Candidatus Sigynarchaeota archaeon]
MSTRQYITRMRVEDWEFHDEPVKMLPVSRYIIILGMVLTATEFVLHAADTRASGRDFAFKNLIYLGLISTYWIIELARRVYVVPNDEVDDVYGGWGRICLHAASATAAVLFVQIVIWVVIQQLPTFSITDIEWYLFFSTSAPIAETVLFQQVTITALKHMIPEPPREDEAVTELNLGKRAPRYQHESWGARATRYMFSLARVLIITSISSLLFMLVHLGVYADDPIVLFSTFLTGCVYAASYYVTENYLVPFIAHVVNNTIAASWVLRNSMIDENPVTAAIVIAVLYVALVLCIIVWWRARSQARQERLQSESRARFMRMTRGGKRC